MTLPAMRPPRALEENNACAKIGGKPLCSGIAKPKRGPRAKVVDLRFKSNGCKLPEDVELELRQSVERLAASIRRSGTSGYAAGVDPSAMHASLGLVGHPTPDVSARWSNLSSRPAEEAYEPRSSTASAQDFEAHITEIQEKISAVNDELQGEEATQCANTPPCKWLSALDDHLESCERQGISSWGESCPDAAAMGNFLAWFEEHEPVDPAFSKEDGAVMQWDRMGSDVLLDAMSRGSTRSASA